MESETKPLKSLKDLLNWKPEPSVVANSTDLYPLSSCFTEKKGKKLLVCHDMAGGYLNDRFVDGYQLENNEEPFYLVHWWYMDIFVYFSHHLVTIPPVTWIKPAHKHGVKVLGTFITEWDDGKKMCSELLSDENKLEKAVSHLVGIAKCYQFDGWLVNIENLIERKHLTNLHKFLRILWIKTKAVLGDQGTVIWYDSVTSTSGSLQWQNELNPLNKQFFNECDGIFLNYCWSGDSLQHSFETAAKLGRQNDVYVGVDVFGRGCFGGGGFNTNLAMEMIQKYNLSAALFAPGWVYETLPKEQFLENLNKYWEMLRIFLECRKLKSIESECINTDFVVGFQEECRKFNLGSMELQPHFFCSGHSSVSILCLGRQHGIQLKPISCVSGTEKDTKHIKLFCCEIPFLPKEEVRLKFQIKKDTTQAYPDIKPSVFFKIKNENMENSEDAEKAQSNLCKYHSTSESEWRCDINTCEHTGWITGFGIEISYTISKVAKNDNLTGDLVPITLTFYSVALE